MPLGNVPSGLRNRALKSHQTTLSPSEKLFISAFIFSFEVLHVWPAVAPLGNIGSRMVLACGCLRAIRSRIALIPAAVSYAAKPPLFVPIISMTHFAR